MNEIWKDVQGYEGFYQVSNLGRVKSLGNDKSKKEKILKAYQGTYQLVVLRVSNIIKTITVHQLVAQAFLGHKICGQKLVVDHINDIKTDNRVENLQIVTNRFNAFKTQGVYSSKYKGVCWNKDANKWVSQIYINKKLTYLGIFINEHEAHLAYQNALNNLEL